MTPKQKRTLEEVKNKSMIITAKPIKWTWPGQKKIGTLRMGATIDRFHGKKVFNVYKQTLGFIQDDKLYITNTTSQNVRVLEENGFWRAFFHVPTASGDGPATT